MNFLRDMIVAVIVFSLFWGLYKLYELYVSRKGKRGDGDDNPENKDAKDVLKSIGKDLYGSEIASIFIQVGLLLFSAVAFFAGAWFSGTGAFVFLLISLWISFFRVPDVFVASPSSFFTGRLRRELDANDFSIPIHKPYREGLHYKPFWWLVELFKRDVKQLVIEGQEYQIGSGGTIIVSGLVQYRVSDIATYRAAEIGNAQVQEGLASEVDQFMIKKLASIEANTKDIDKDGKVDIDTGIDFVIQTRAQLSKEMEDMFKSTILGEQKDADGLTKIIKRELFGKSITYSEQGYGVEVLTARINKVDPVEKIKAERDKIQEERYQTRSETIQINHFVNRVGEVFEAYKAMGKEISPKEATEIVQLNLKLTSKEIKELQVNGVEGVVADLFTKWRGGAQ